MAITAAELIAVVSVQGAEAATSALMNMANTVGSLGGLFGPGGALLSGLVGAGIGLVGFGVGIGADGGRLPAIHEYGASSDWCHYGADGPV